MKKKTVTLELTATEKQRLRANKIRQATICDCTAEELCAVLGVPERRGKQLHALIEFQRIPSVGIRFAQDLADMGYYSISQLKGKDGARLTEQFEQLKQCRMDPCVEDQFRLVVHYANTGDDSKRWWDFTEERKRHRLQHGYP